MIYLLIGAGILFTLALVLAAGVVFFLWYRGYARDQELVWVNVHGEPAAAWVCVCNVNLSGGPPADGWVIALISPDPQVDGNELDRILTRLEDAPDSDDELASAILAITPMGQRYQPGFRLRIPDAVTVGREVYVAHVWVRKSDTPRPLSPADTRFPLECMVGWHKSGSVMCTRSPGLASVFASTPPAATPAADTPRIDGPFAARFLTYSRVPFARELRVRLASGVSRAVTRRPWVVSEATRRLQMAVQDPSHPHAALANELFHSAVGDPPVRLPDAFAQGEEVWLYEARLAVDDLPADSRDAWAIPQDLFCSTLRLNDGRLTFAEPPADTVVGRQQQRVRAAERNGGVPVTAIVVQANSSLFSPGDDDQPSTVVYSPDPTVGLDLLRQLADQVATLKGQEQTDPDLRMLSEYVTYETACPYRRRRVAGRLTDGSEVYIADLRVYRHLLSEGILRGQDALLCVAEPGEDGGALELTRPTSSDRPTAGNGIVRARRVETRS